MDVFRDVVTLLPIAALACSLSVVAFAGGFSPADGAQGESPLRAERPDPQQAATAKPELADIVNEYLRGDTNAALVQFGRLARAMFQTGQPLRTEAVVALLHTESGMNTRTFGRYSRSAPLVAARPSVGLTGMFEPDSLIADRLMNDVLARATATPDAAFSGIVRDWYIVVVSYCLRWRLDSADALLAEARSNFPDEADILLLAGSVAETHGRLRDAEALLRRVIAVDPSMAEAHLRLGRVLERTGRTSEARRELDRGVSLTAKSVDLFSRHFGLLLLADLDQRAGQSVRARARRAEAARTMPVDAAFLRREDLTAWQLYAAAQFWQQTDRIAAIRRTLRAMPAESSEK